MIHLLLFSCFGEGLDKATKERSFDSAYTTAASAPTPAPAPALSYEGYEQYDEDQMSLEEEGVSVQTSTKSLKRDKELFNEEIDAQFGDMSSSAQDFFTEGAGKAIGNVSAGGDVAINYAPTKTYIDNREYRIDEKTTTTNTSVDARMSLI